jgi:hypothetical protein
MGFLDVADVVMHAQTVAPDTVASLLRQACPNRSALAQMLAAAVACPVAAQVVPIAAAWAARQFRAPTDLYCVGLTMHNLGVDRQWVFAMARAWTGWEALAHELPWAPEWTDPVAVRTALQQGMNPNAKFCLTPSIAVPHHVAVRAAGADAQWATVASRVLCVWHILTAGGTLTRLTLAHLVGRRAGTPAAAVAAAILAHRRVSVGDLRVLARTGGRMAAAELVKRAAFGARRQLWTAAVAAAIHT